MMSIYSRAACRSCATHTFVCTSLWLLLPTAPNHVQGVGLCHGICGNGYALLALARATGEARWLSAAQAFALHAARHWEQLAEVPDRPASLYEVRGRAALGGCKRSICILRVVVRQSITC